MKKNNDLLFVIFLLFMSLNLSGDNEKKIRVNLCKISMPEVVIQFAKSANAHTVQIYSSFLVKKDGALILERVSQGHFGHIPGVLDSLKPQILKCMNHWHLKGYGGKGGVALFFWTLENGLEKICISVGKLVLEVDNEICP